MTSCSPFDAARMKTVTHKFHITGIKIYMIYVRCSECFTPGSHDPVRQSVGRKSIVFITVNTMLLLRTFTITVTVSPFFHASVLPTQPLTGSNSLISSYFIYAYNSYFKGKQLTKDEVNELVAAASYLFILRETRQKHFLNHTR